MDHMPLCGDSPLRALSLTLVQMMAILGPLASESVAAMAEGDFVFTEGDDHPSAHEVQQTMEALRAEMELATDEMIRWRLQKDDQSGLKADRRLYAAILTIEEMRYYDLFPTLTLIQTILKNYQWRFQTALFERNQDRIQQAAMAGQQTQ
jgi:sensor c-di-GMP phosphodiesterase-like protein